MKTRRRAGKTPSKLAATALGRVREICLALADTSEKIAWGAPTFRVRDRLFVMYVSNHHGDGRLALWCNAAPGALEGLVAAEPQHFFVPPYVGCKGWLGVRLDRGMDWAQVTAHCEGGLPGDGAEKPAPLFTSSTAAAS